MDLPPQWLGLAGLHWVPLSYGVVDLKAARRVSATDLSCGPTLSEMLYPPLALHLCRTQVTQPSGTRLLVPGPLCEEESLGDSVGYH